MSDLKRSLTSSPRARWSILGYGMLIFLMLPRGIPVMSDDFGYLGSVIETLRHRRPWTDDWLEPWSASIAAIAAIFYKITGSFQIATQGLQTVCAMASFVGAYVLCCSRGFASGKSIAISIIGLTFPALLWKSIDFTALILYIPCLLWAIWAATNRRWGLFYVVWAIAFSSRQSAIVWLILPLGEVLQNIRLLDKKVMWSPAALVLWGAMIMFVVLSVGMNQTQSQKMVTQHIFDQILATTSFRNFAIALGVCAVFSGIGALALRWRQDGLPVARNFPVKIVTILILGVGLFSFIETFHRLFAEHQSFEGWSGRLYSNLVIAAGVAGWLIFRFSFRWESLVASIAAGSLVCLRTEVWDYYYADVAILAFFSVVPPREIAPAEPGQQPSGSLGIALVVLFSVFHLYFAFGQKCRVDRDYAICVILEKALRAGEIDISDIGNTPYGFVGWHLHRHFVDHDGKNDPDIGGFMRYQRAGASELLFSPMRFWQDSRSLQKPGGEAAPRVIRSELFRVGWLWHQRITLLQAASREQIQPGKLTLDRSKYRPRRFPLTDQEWRENIELPSP